MEAGGGRNLIQFSVPARDAQPAELDQAESALDSILSAEMALKWPQKV